MSRNRNFVRFWAGESISFVGSQITRFALPLVAVIFLQARPEQMGLLLAAEATPALVLGLPAGAWIDRLPRRPFLIAWDVAAALICASIPLGATLGVLSMAWLYAVGALTGVLDAFGAAWHAFIPTIVGRDDLTAANGKLEASSAAASIVGPGLAGVLVQALTAPLALLADAASYVVSALFLSTIRTADAPTRMSPRRTGIWWEIRDGLRATFLNPLQRTITGVLGVQVLAGAMLGAVYGIYVVRHLGVRPAVLGMISAIGGAGALAGSLSSARLRRWLGLGRASLLGGTLFALSPFLIVLTTRAQAPGTRFALLLTAALLGGIGAVSLAVILSSLRQAITATHLLGRVYASERELLALLALVGGLAGGFLGGVFGARAGIAAAACVQLLIVVWIAVGPLRGLHEVPQRLLAEPGSSQAGPPSSP